MPEVLDSRGQTTAFPWQLMILFGLVLNYDFSRAQSSQECNCPVMRPASPFAFVGDEIQLCCRHLYPPGTMINAEDVDFRCSPGSFHLGETYFATGTQQQNQVCVNATALVPGKEGRWCECEYKSEKASQFLRIDDRPVVDKDFSCIFHDGKHFNCTWSPQKFALPENIKVHLLYRNSSLWSGKKVSCKADPPCSIPDISGVFFKDYNVSLIITYNTPSGKSIVSQAEWKEFHLPSIVKLLSLPVLFESSNETCITLQWSKISQNEIIQFNFTSQWNPGSIEKSFQVETELADPFSDGFFHFTANAGDQKHEFCHLTPHTDYIITVTIRPILSDLWSDPYILNGSTLEDVPSRSPLTVEGAFTRTSENGAILYWKGLSAEEWQSNRERAFHITIWSYPLSSWQPFDTLDETSFQVEIPLVDEEGTLVRLQAYNNQGPARDHSEIFISPKGKKFSPANVSVITQANSANVVVTWDVLFLADEAVIFWCPRGNFDYQCLNEKIDWQQQKDVVNKPVTVEIPNIHPASRYMFGVSLSRADVSSGITWTNCSNVVEGRTTYRSNCNIPQSKAIDDEWKMQILLPVLVVIGVIILVFLFVWWFVTRCKKHSKTFDLSSKIMLDEAPHTIPYPENRENPDIDRQSAFASEADDNSFVEYLRICEIQSSSTSQVEKESPKRKNSITGNNFNSDDMDSDEESHYIDPFTTDILDDKHGKDHNGFTGDDDAPSRRTVNFDSKDKDSGKSSDGSTGGSTENSTGTSSMSNTDRANSITSDDMDSDEESHYIDPFTTDILDDKHGKDHNGFTGDDDAPSRRTVNFDSKDKDSGKSSDGSTGGSTENSTGTSSMSNTDRANSITSDDMDSDEESHYIDPFTINILDDKHGKDHNGFTGDDDAPSRRTKNFDSKDKDSGKSSDGSTGGSTENSTGTSSMSNTDRANSITSDDMDSDEESHYKYVYDKDSGKSSDGSSGVWVCDLV